ncbi:hypothetical protein KSP39_PZI018459 [Platanthera zijinensis]|uniref:Uncharacterized protein n=1 Tax=Platanthera zijinensis TaxID=2320716 RepID=A0AAP0B4H2_9ASPA
MSRKPVRATFTSLYGQPNSDAEFVRSVAGEAVVDSYSCRQMYLRSYPFSAAKKESMPEKTRRNLRRAKDLAGAAIQVFPGQRRRRQLRRVWTGEMNKRRYMRGANPLTRATVSAVCFFIRRLFSCATAVTLRRPVIAESEKLKFSR